MSKHLSRSSPGLADLAAMLGESSMAQQATDYAVLGGSAAAGILAGRLLRKQGLDRLAFLPGIVKPLVGVAVGFGAGMALQRVDRRVAAGFAAGVIGEAVGSLVVSFVPALGGLAQITEEDLLLGTGSVGQGDDAEAEELTRELLSGPRGARQFDVEEGDFGAFDIETDDRLAAVITG